MPFLYDAQTGPTRRKPLALYAVGALFTGYALSDSPEERAVWKEDGARWFVMALDRRDAIQRVLAAPGIAREIASCWCNATVEAPTFLNQNKFYSEKVRPEDGAARILYVVRAEDLRGMRRLRRSDPTQLVQQMMEPTDVSPSILTFKYIGV